MPAPSSSDAVRQSLVALGSQWILHRSRRPDVGYSRVAASASVPTVAIQKPWAVDEVAVDVVQDRDSTCHAVMTARVEATPMRIYTLFEREDYDKIFEIFKALPVHGKLIGSCTVLGGETV